MSNADAFAPLFDALDQTGPAPEDSRWLFLNADADHRLAGIVPNSVTSAVTPNRTQHLRLAAALFDSTPAIPDGAYGRALVRLTRDRAETLGLIAEAAARIGKGGEVFVFGENDEGIKTVEKLVEARWPVLQRQSKRHARCFVFAADGGTMEDWRKAALPDPSLGYVSQPGLFAHDRIDLGSAMLIDALPEKLKGEAADFGCGWGALAVALANRNPAITSIALFDNDHRAVQAAAANLAAAGYNGGIGKHWADIAAGETPKRIFDIIVMNPPFHAGNRPDHAIGNAFINAASAALKPGGQLYMVANRKLPYEPALKAGFRMTSTLHEGDGYKIIRAMR